MLPRGMLLLAAQGTHLPTKLSYRNLKTSALLVSPLYPEVILTYPADTLTGEQSEQLNEQPINELGSEVVGASLNESVNSGLSDYRRRRNREITRSALKPDVSFARFRESFEHSNMPESLKERFRHLK